MTFGIWERLSIHLTAALSILLIATTGEIPPLAWGFTATALAGRILFALKARPIPLPPAGVLGFAVVVLAGVDLFLLAENVLVAAVDLVLVLLAVKLLGANRVRDNQQIIGLTFLLVLSATVLTAEAIFGLIFLAYVFAALWALLLQNLRAQWEGAGNAPAGLGRRRGVLGRTFGAAVALLGLGIIVFTLVFYFLFPRVGMRWWSSPLGYATRSSGFSQVVNLNDIGRIQPNPNVALRVEYVDGPPPPPHSDLRKLRGVVLDQFDGGSWRDSRNDAKGPVVRQTQGKWILDERASEVRFRVMPESDYAGSLFLPREAVAIKGPFRSVTRTRSGNVLAMPSRGPPAYTVEAALAPPPVAPASAPADAGAGMTMPTHLAVEENLRDMLANATRTHGGALTGRALAERIETSLKQNFSYTLDIPANQSHPLAIFLNETRAGHCELFASAFALMLRTRGVPTRIVNGFVVGERWSENVVVFREMHAHSWVEAYFADAGWIQFDPSPDARMPTSLGFQLSHLLHRTLDNARFLWGAWFVEYDFQRQAQIAGDFRRTSTDVGDRLNTYRKQALEWLARADVRRLAGLLALGAGLAALLGIGLRRRRHTGRFLKGDRLQRLYRKRLHALERHHPLSPRSPHEPPLGYAHRLAAGDPRWISFVDYTRLYYQLRYGDRHTSPEAGIRFLELHQQLPALLRSRRRDLLRRK